MRLLQISLFTTLTMMLLPACVQDHLELDPEDVEDLAGSLEPSSDEGVSTDIIEPPPPPPPPCIEQGCNGLDPAGTGCDDSATTLDTCEIVDPNTGYVVGIAELRYSYGCGTKWSLATMYIPQASMLRAIVIRSDGLTYSDIFTNPQPGQYQIWSPMVYEPTGPSMSARARGRVGDLKCHTDLIQ